MDQVASLAVEKVEHSGIIFLDEVDKVAGRETGRGPEVSREGVQRDLLPIIEGTTVNTRFGLVKTDHILFIWGFPCLQACRPYTGTPGKIPYQSGADVPV